MQKPMHVTKSEELDFANGIFFKFEIVGVTYKVNMPHTCYIIWNANGMNDKSRE